MPKDTESNAPKSEPGDEGKTLQELALVDEVCQLPKHMQAIYLRLIATIDHSLQRLRPAGASPEQLSEVFIEQLVNQMLDEDLSQDSLEREIDKEFQRQILLQDQNAELLPC